MCEHVLNAMNGYSGLRSGVVKCNRTNVL